MNKKISLRAFLGMLAIVLIFLSVGYVHGYYEAIGVFPYPPFLSRPLPPMPPDHIPMHEQTFKDVSGFVADSIISGNTYEEGMNCVDFALLMARDAHWKGIGADVIKIEYVGYELAHAALVFPTSDQGLVFVDPQTDRVIDLRVGGKYAGKTIAELYIMKIDWIPLSYFLDGGNGSNEIDR